MIKQDNPSHVSAQKHALFDKWLRICPSASWDKVVMTLEAIDENHLAEKILHVAHKKKLAQEVLGTVSQEVTIQEDTVWELSELNQSFCLLSFEFVQTLRERIDRGSIQLSDVVLRAKQERPLHDIKELNEAKSIDQFFDIISPHYHFLDFHLLLVLAKQFINPSELLDKLQMHRDNVRKFMNSTKIRQLYLTLSPLIIKPPQDTPISVIVQYVWEKHELCLVECLLQALFHLAHMDIPKLFRVIPG